MKKVLIITSLWCPSCLVMRPRYEKLFIDKDIKVEEYDYDEEKELMEKYKVGKILPELILIKKNQVVLKVVGEKSKRKLNKLTKEFFDE